jgi:hypothetical protein
MTWNPHSAMDESLDTRAARRICNRESAIPNRD